MVSALHKSLHFAVGLARRLRAEAPESHWFERVTLTTDPDHTRSERPTANTPAYRRGRRQGQH
jgi:hypothetical protein